MYIKKGYELTATSKGSDAEALRTMSMQGAGAVTYYFDADLSDLEDFAPEKNIIIITDEHVYQHQIEKFSGYPIIKFAAGEQFKNQETVDYIIQELIALEAGKNTFIVGVGGGVVTDIAGYVAAIYMRGVQFALAPTSILAMVDAAIGGKNGIDVGVFKNMVGTIHQPAFIVYDYSMLKTLPVTEWINGFAEIIKHACIKDAVLFSILERYTLHQYQSDITLVAELIEKNVAIKNAIVSNDEFEKGERKLLNFGHTVGHAIENLHRLSHGQAISIGMVAACNLSEQLCGLPFEEARRVIKLLAQYHLPVDIETDHQSVFDVLKMDKKRVNEQMNFILLNKIGNAIIHPVFLTDLYDHLNDMV